jgi:protein-tyrosine phosphatase
MTHSPTTKVLLVCRANLCRSPMALAVMTRQVSQTAGPARIALASAGTHALTRHHPPDPRATATLLRHGYLAPPRGTRTVQAQDFLRFDLLLAMDQHNLADLQALCPAAERHKIQLFLQHARGASRQVIQDPYYGAPAGFERVLHLCEVGACGLLALLQT